MALHPLNSVIVATLIALAVFAAMVLLVPMTSLIVFLNAIFAGTMIAISVAYWRLLLNAILGIRPYDRVRQMTLGFALCWLAYLLTVAVSVYLRSSGVDVTSNVLTAASRYVAIIAAGLQVSAPDFGLGLFHGRDRKVLATGITLGVITAAVVVLGQTQEVLAAGFLVF